MKDDKDENDSFENEDDSNKNPDEGFKNFIDMIRSMKNDKAKELGEPVSVDNASGDDWSITKKVYMLNGERIVKVDVVCEGEPNLELLKHPLIEVEQGAEISFIVKGDGGPINGAGLLSSLLPKLIAEGLGGGGIGGGMGPLGIPDFFKKKNVSELSKLEDKLEAAVAAEDYEAAARLRDEIKALANKEKKAKRDLILEKVKDLIILSAEDNDFEGVRNGLAKYDRLTELWDKEDKLDEQAPQTE